VEPRITRTVQATGTTGRTHVTATATSIGESRRGRAFVRAAVWWTRVWRAAGSGITTAAEWAAAMHPTWKQWLQKKD
jgi:hypothetical protein